MSPKTPEPRSTKLLTDWLRPHITIQNVLMVLVLATQAGQYWERQQTTNRDLANAVSSFEVRLEASEQREAQTYARRDVIEVTLRAIEARLQAIEGLLRRRD